MKRFLCIFLCFLSIMLFACQRFEKPTEREGLDKDSHSYSNVSFPESRMKQIARNVEGVEDVRVEYNQKNIVMYVLPASHLSASEYRDLANRVYKKVNQSTPLNPFHVEIVPPEKWMETPY